MATGMRITIDPDNNLALIRAGMVYNDAIRKLPNRLFSKKRKAWAAPLIRRNAEYILDYLVKFPSCEISDEARAVLLRVAEEKPPPPKIPFPGSYPFKTTPTIHQMDALNFAWSMPAVAFFIGIGGGKSKTVIDLAVARYIAGEIELIVVMCQYALTTNWCEEFAKHSPMEVDLMVVETTRYRFARESMEFASRKPDKLKVLICGHESMSGMLGKGKAFEFVDRVVRDHKSMVSIDEAHWIKNPDSNRTANITSVGSNAEYRTLMTGTPVPQSILDLYAQVNFLSPDILGIGDWMSFKRRYAVFGGYENKQVIDYDNTEELMSVIAPWVFQRTRAEVLRDVPDPVNLRRVVSMTAKQAEIYQKVTKERCAHIDGLIDAGYDIDLVCANVLSAMVAQQQIAAGFVSYWHKVDEETKERRVSRILDNRDNPKLQELMQVLIECDCKVIVWASFREEIRMVTEELSSRFGADSYAEYHGGVDKDSRDVEMARFRTDDRCRFFVSNQKTGGTGQTINEAEMAVFYSNDQMYVNRTQAEGRNHRIGQTKVVAHVDVMVKGTVDATILASFERKEDVAEYVRSSITMRQARAADLLMANVS